MDKDKDYHAVLGVAVGATKEEISNAFRSAALRWHPDKNPGNLAEAEMKMKEITEAHSALKHGTALGRKRSAPGGSSSDGVHSAPKCHCSMPATRRQVKKDGPNQGKWFWTCASGTCKFFDWVEVTGSCLKCGQAGHWAKDCPLKRSVQRRRTI